MNGRANHGALPDCGLNGFPASPAISTFFTDKKAERAFLSGRCAGGLAARPAAMDNAVGDPYLPNMFARFPVMLAMLAIALTMAMGSAHAARVGVGPDHAGHPGRMMQAQEIGDVSCSEEPSCGWADAGACALSCAGLSAFLPAPGGRIGAEVVPAGHDPALTAHPASHVPELNERPPRHGLLQARSG